MPLPDRVNVLGLNMSTATQVELVTAIRARWPALTAGQSDTRAVQTVLKEIVRDTLAWYRASQAVPDVNAEMEIKRRDLQRQQETASDGARQLVDTDVQVTSP